MGRHCFLLAVLFLLLCGTGRAIAQDAEAKKPAQALLPPVWQDLIAEVRAIVAADPKDQRHPDRSKLVASSAQKLADKYGRPGIIALYQHPIASVHALKSDAEQRVGYDLYNATIVSIGDPTNSLEVQIEPGRVNGYLDLNNLVLVVVDLYHDKESRKFLIQETILDPETAEERLGNNDRPYLDRAAGMQLLRGYEMEDVRAKIESTRDKWLPASKDTEKPQSSHRASSEVGQLNALLASMEYAKSLPDDATRKRYRQFETRLWQSWALAGGKRSRKGGVAHEGTARALTHRVEYKFVDGYTKPAFTPDWDTANEPFLMRIMSDAPTIGTEVGIASYMEIPLTEESQAQLLGTAESDSKKAQYARQMLDRQTPRQRVLKPSKPVQ